MRKFFYFVTSHPHAVLTLAGAVFLVFGGFVLTLTRDPSPDSFIPKDLPALARKQQVEREFGLTEPMVVAVFRDAPGGVFTPETLRLISDLTTAIRQLPQVKPDDVLSIATESGVFFRDGEPAFQPLMKKIPDTPAACADLKQTVLEYELYRGTLVAADGTAACIVIRPSSSADDDRLYRALADLIAATPVRDERLVVAGEAAVRAHMGAAVSDDALRMNFICPVVMALLIVLAYRTVGGALLPLAVVGGASALALGSMGAAGIPIYIVTNGIFVVIMALAVDNSFHLIGQFYEEQLDPRGRTRQQLIIDACMVLWFPVFITSLTDTAGFVGLYFGGLMPPIEYFGLFTCIGVLGALFFAGTVVPAGLMIGSRRTEAAPARTAEAPSPESPVGLDRLGRLLGDLGGLVYRRPWQVMAVGAVMLAAAGWGASKLIVNDARILAFKDDHPLVQATKAINRRFDGTSFLNILVTAGRPGDLLQPDVLKRIADLEAFTETLPHVGGTHSLAGWVKRAHQKMHQENPAFYAIPANVADTKFYLDTLIAPTSPMSRSLREVVDPTYAKTNLIIRLKSSEYIHERPVLQAVQEYLDRRFADGRLTAQLAGRADLDCHWLALIRTSHIRSVVPSLIWVLVLTSLMFRSPAAGLLCTLTAGAAVLVNYAIMGLGGIPLGVGTSMFAGIAIGAGVNFPVHILERMRLDAAGPGSTPERVFRQTFAFTGRPLFFTALVIGAGFLLLCVSQFRTLNEFGLLIGTAMVVTFVTSMTVMPAIVAVWRPRLIWPARPPNPSQMPPAIPQEPPPLAGG